MPARAAWKGFLQINQLQVPVKAFTASSTQSEITLNQLHRECGERIRQIRFCPVHGELRNEELISGYQCGEGQFLPLSDEDLTSLQPNDDKIINVDCFVNSQHIDAVYHSGRTYYVVPDGPPGQRPFCVLRDGMRANDRYAVSRVVIGHRELLVLLRPLQRLIAMTVLEYPQHVRPATEYEGEVAAIATGAVEQQLIGELISALSEEDLDLSRYRDRYADGLARLIEQRLGEAPQVTDAEAPDWQDEAHLVAALRASLAAAGAGDGPPTRTLAPSTPRRDSSNDIPARKLG